VAGCPHLYPNGQTTFRQTRHDHPCLWLIPWMGRKVNANGQQQAQLAFWSGLDGARRSQTGSKTGPCPHNLHLCTTHRPRSDRTNRVNTIFSPAMICTIRKHQTWWIFAQKTSRRTRTVMLRMIGLVSGASALTSEESTILTTCPQYCTPR